MVTMHVGCWYAGRADGVRIRCDSIKASTYYTRRCTIFVERDVRNRDDDVIMSAGEHTNEGYREDGRWHGDFENPLDAVREIPAPAIEAPLQWVWRIGATYLTRAGFRVHYERPIEHACRPYRHLCRRSGVMGNGPLALLAYQASGRSEYASRAWDIVRMLTEDEARTMDAGERLRRALRDEVREHCRHHAAPESALAPGLGAYCLGVSARGLREACADPKAGERWVTREGETVLLRARAPDRVEDPRPQVGEVWETRVGERWRLRANNGKERGNPRDYPLLGDVVVANADLDRTAAYCPAWTEMGRFLHGSVCEHRNDLVLRVEEVKVAPVRSPMPGESWRTGAHGVVLLRARADGDGGHNDRATYVLAGFVPGEDSLRTWTAAGHYVAGDSGSSYDLVERVAEVVDPAPAEIPRVAHLRGDDVDLGLVSTQWRGDCPNEVWGDYADMRVVGAGHPIITRRMSVVFRGAALVPTLVSTSGMRVPLGIALSHLFVPGTVAERREREARTDIRSMGP